MYASKKTNGIVFAIFLLVALAVTSPVRSSLGNHDSSKFSIRHNAASPRSPSCSTALSPPQTPKVPRHRHLLQRSLPNPGPIQNAAAFGWQVRYRQYFSFIIPVQVAASVLEDFYADCLQHVSMKLLQNKPSPGTDFTFSIGSVFLSFRAPDQVLSWESCETIIDAMLANLRMGFTAQFNSEWFHPETNELVYLSLSMLQRIEPGRVEA